MNYWSLTRRENRFFRTIEEYKMHDRTNWQYMKFTMNIYNVFDFENILNFHHFFQFFHWRLVLGVCIKLILLIRTVEKMKRLLIDFSTFWGFFSSSNSFLFILSFLFVFRLFLVFWSFHIFHYTSDMLRMELAKYRPQKVWRVFSISS